METKRYVALHIKLTHTISMIYSYIQPQLQNESFYNYFRYYCDAFMYTHIHIHSHRRTRSTWCQVKNSNIIYETHQWGLSLPFVACSTTSYKFCGVLSWDFVYASNISFIQLYFERDKRFKINLYSPLTNWKQEKNINTLYGEIKKRKKNAEKRLSKKNYGFGWISVARIKTVVTHDRNWYRCLMLKVLCYQSSVNFRFVFKMQIKSVYKRSTRKLFTSTHTHTIHIFTTDELHCSFMYNAFTVPVKRCKYTKKTYRKFSCVRVSVDSH